MSNWEDYYGLLQVHPQAELDIIQSAYKRLCKKYHPDVNRTPGAAVMMKRLNAAFETLSDTHKRTRYHSDWQRQNKNNPVAASRPVEVRERVVYVDRTPAEPSHGGTPEAAKAVQEYFRCLSSRDHKGAFALISQADRQCFGYGSYVEWQESVSTVYELGNVRIKLFKRYDAYKLSNGQKVPAEEYTVTVTEKNRAAGTMQQYDLSKYAVKENGVWRVYLGYQDLTPLKMQFKAMATDTKEVQLLSLWEKYRELNDADTGLPSRQGFEKDVEREIYRNKRYAHPFSVAVMELTLPEHMEGDLAAKVRRYAGYVLREAIRCIDCAAWLGDDSYGILFGDTDRQAAASAVRRVLNTVRHHIAACFDFEAVICVGLAHYNGHSFEELLEECTRTIRVAGGTSQRAAVQ